MWNFIYLALESSINRGKTIKFILLFVSALNYQGQNSEIHSLPFIRIISYPGENKSVLLLIILLSNYSCSWLTNAVLSSIGLETCNFISIPQTFHTTASTCLIWMKLWIRKIMAKSPITIEAGSTYSMDWFF
jgi:hypothetical protein